MKREGNVAALLELANGLDGDLTVKEIITGIMTILVGSGLLGSTSVQEAADRGKHCLVIDGRRHLGGNVCCENVDGICVTTQPSKFAPL